MILHKSIGLVGFTFKANTSTSLSLLDCLHPNHLVASNKPDHQSTHVVTLSNSHLKTNREPPCVFQNMMEATKLHFHTSLDAAVHGNNMLIAILSHFAGCASHVPSAAILATISLLFVESVLFFNLSMSHAIAMSVQMNLLQCSCIQSRRTQILQECCMIFRDHHENQNNFVCCRPDAAV